jgi:hypothetical protein
MVLKAGVAALGLAALLAASAAMADEYKPDEFLSLDLSKAALSPKPLGPASQFEPAPVEANSSAETAHAGAEPKAAPKVRVGDVRAQKRSSIVHAKPAAAPAAAPTKLARKRTNPLDAQASDRRIQVWPCRSGGICNWHRPAP